jgi:hypothetical protein
MIFGDSCHLRLGWAGLFTFGVSLWPSLVLGAASSLSLSSGTADQTVSVARILAVLALGCILAIGASLLIARHRLSVPKSLTDWAAGLGRPVDGTQSDLVVLASRPLAQGSSAHHVRLAGQDWLVVVGTGGVCAVMAGPTERPERSA